MEVTLTTGAVERIMKKEVSNGNDLQPVLQVTEMKTVASVKTQIQPRLRLLLSDGCMTVQSMLGGNSHHLVESKRVQVGSVIRLKQFICNLVQDRLIVIIVELEVLVEKWEIIGKTVPAPRFSRPMQPSTDQSGAVMGNGQNFGGGNSVAYGTKDDPDSGTVTGNNCSFGGGNSVSYGTNDNQNARGTFLQQPRINQFHGGSYVGEHVAARYPVANTSLECSKVEPATGIPPTGQMHEPYGGQSTVFHNPRAEVSRPASTFNRPTVSAYQQPPPMYASRGPISRNEAPARIVPITTLNPYVGKWTIKARVTVKGELRRYNNARGEGKVFSFDLLDADGGEIRVTCFNAVADQFFSQIEAGRIYLISKGNLRPAQKNFNHLSNDHEIFLEITSMVQMCTDDDDSIPRQVFHFREIHEIESIENNSIIDVIGVVTFISPAASIMRKNGTETQKRTLHLKDMSGRSVELTLWGSFCNSEGQTLQSMCDNGGSPVLAVKSGRVSDFNGKAVGTISTSQLFIEPGLPEAHRIREWFNKEGRNTPSISISRDMSSVGKTDSRKTISQIKDEKLGTSEKPDWITVAATITYIKLDNFCYTACPIKSDNADRPCSKKVTNNGDGKWWCDKCDRSVDDCDYRYIIQFQIQDHTGITWLTAFQEAGEELIGISAKELYCLKYENQNDDKFMEIMRQVMFKKYLFKLKVKEETYSDEQRVKSTVMKVEKVNFMSESRYLLGLIDKIKNVSSDPFASTHPGTNISGCGTGADQSRMLERATAGKEHGASANQMMPQLTSVSGVYMSCSNCGLTGHSSVNCPRKSVDRGMFSGAGSECYKCHQPGHWAKDCPTTAVFGNSPYKSGSIPR